MDTLRIERILSECLRNKFRKYKPEPNAMPFHVRLLGQDRLALYQFIHSLNTAFGSSVFEPVAVAIAENRFAVATRQYHAGNSIKATAEQEITRIMRELGAGERVPSQPQEFALLKAACQQNSPLRNVRLTRVDLFLQDHEGRIFLCEMKTAKPNSSEYKRYKQTLMEWTAAVLSEAPDTNIHAMIAIPYNPYAPEPYQRWTMRGMLDTAHEMRVAEEFWDFLGGEGTYNTLLECFERVGMAMREEIDTYFSRFR
jgi:type II restriction enzyme